MPLAEIGPKREGAAASTDALQLGFRGFAAGFQTSVDPFLERHGGTLAGLTRIATSDTFIDCVRDMRPDYVVLESDNAIYKKLESVVRTPQLGVLVTGEASDVWLAPSGPIVAEPVSSTASAFEVALTLRALMRRTRPQAMVGQTTWGDFDLDEACLTISIDGRSVPLSLEVFGVLGLMMDDPSRVWERTELHRYVFGAGSDNDIRSIDTRISRARRHVVAALGADPIRTVRGVGYALVEGP